jgi:hypothetical protein
MTADKQRAVMEEPHVLSFTYWKVLGTSRRDGVVTRHNRVDHQSLQFTTSCGETATPTLQSGLQQCETRHLAATDVETQQQVVENPVEDPKASQLLCAVGLSGEF